jgi:hypothetical protein
MQTISSVLQTMIQTNYTQKSKPKNNIMLKHITIIYKSNQKCEKKGKKKEKWNDSNCIPKEG